MQKAGQLRNILIVWSLYRNLAWRGMEFPAMGIILCRLPSVRKVFLKERLEKCPAFIRWLYAMLAVFMGWVLFAFDDMQAGLLYFRQLFGAAGLSLVNERTLYILFTNLILMAHATAIGATSLPIAFCRGAYTEKSLPILEPIFVAAVLLVSTAFLVNAGYNPFLYFQILGRGKHYAQRNNDGIGFYNPSGFTVRLKRRHAPEGILGGGEPVSGAETGFHDRIV